MTRIRTKTSAGKNGRCRSSSCREGVHSRKDSSGIKEYSDYCKDHACKAKLPDQGVIICRNERGIDPRYCEKHRQCGDSECSQLLDLGDVPLPWFCQTHKCPKKDCEKPRCLDGYHCLDHDNCIVENCPRRGGPTRRCPGHMPCGQDGCRYSAIEDEELCPRHVLCFDPGCLNVIDCTIVKFCPKHTCQLKGCKNPRDRDYKFCIRDKCNEDDCGEVKLTLNNPMCAFCFHHLCKVTGCPFLVVRYSTLCEEHKCIKENCHNKRTSQDSQYCHGHQCRDPTCKAEATIQGGYCEEHGCRKPECPEVRYTKFALELCVDHTVEELSQQRDAAMRKLERYEQYERARRDSPSYHSARRSGSSSRYSSSWHDSNHAEYSSSEDGSDRRDREFDHPDFPPQNVHRESPRWGYTNQR